MKWIGKVQAEGNTCDNMWMLTLTYRDSDSPDSIVLRYPPIQRMFKRMRESGLKFRYFICGEYGGQKARAHWHAIIFWQGDPPDAEFSVNQYEWPYWPEGYTYIEQVRDVTHAGTYVAKYMLKDDQAIVRASTRPALGEIYLLEYAQKRAIDGKPLFGEYVTYTTGAYAKTGGLFQYHMDKASRLPAKMAEIYLKTWAQHRPNQTLQYHPNTQEYFDEIALDLDFSLPQNQAVRTYLDRHYGHEVRHIRSVVETHPDGWLTVYTPTFVAVEKRNIKGEIVWHAVIVRSRENHKAEPDEFLRNRVKRIIATAPSRLQRIETC